MMKSSQEAGPGRGLLVSTEGIPGVGKSFLSAQAMKSRLAGHNIVLYEDIEVELGRYTGLREDLKDALRSASDGDPFLRCGHPTSELFVQMALKRADFENVRNLVIGGASVIEGRSVDSVAVCQATLLHPDRPDRALAEANRILELISLFRPHPDLTILVVDDFEPAFRRAAKRDRRELTGEQQAWIVAVGELYLSLASLYPARFRVLDLRLVDEAHATDLISDWVLLTRPQVPVFGTALSGLTGWPQAKSS
jgi:dTMP kinase